MPAWPDNGLGIPDADVRESRLPVSGHRHGRENERVCGGQQRPAAGPGVLLIEHERQVQLALTQVAPGANELPFQPGDVDVVAHEEIRRGTGQPFGLRARPLDGGQDLVGPGLPLSRREREVEHRILQCRELRLDDRLQRPDRPLEDADPLQHPA